MGRKLAHVKGPLDIRISPVAQSRQGKWKQNQNALKPFIAWDGEACKDAGYCLFGNSMGMELCKPDLGSEELLEFLLEAGRTYPDAFHIGYVFGYDVNQIIKDMDRLHVAILHKLGHVTWRGFRIKHVPSKIFEVSRVKDVVRIEDIFHFFRTRYDNALWEYDIGTLEERERITAGKEEREDFYWIDIEQIREYFRAELKTMVLLMDRIRTDVNAAGFYIGQWYGPGALAKYALRARKMGQHKADTPEEILDAVLGAYSGGWFERFKAGYHDGPVWTADLNSAYIYAASLLPSLRNGRWRHLQAVDISQRDVGSVRFAIFRIRFKGSFNIFMQTNLGMPLPLFQRQSNGTLTHPIATEGWYWNPEAELVVDLPEAEFLEAWVFEDDGTYPFTWVEEEYDKRARLKAMGNPAEVAIKWALASMYGGFAQRVGWDEKNNRPPRWHQIEWAGWITSMCRALIYRTCLMLIRLNGLVSIDTDGIISTVPFDFAKMTNGVGSGLGQWEVKEYTALVYIQNGVYWLKKKDGTWEDPKLRGIPKGKKVTVEQAIEALQGDGKITISRRQFIGYGAALQGRWNEWCTWVDDDDYTINVHKAGSRQHVPMMCRACKWGFRMDETLHDLALVPSPELVSVRHTLPWLDGKGKGARWELADVMRHYAMADEV